MKRITLIICLLSFLFIGCKDETTSDEIASKSDTTSTATKDEEPSEPRDSAAMMKAWQEYATPGEPHKMLAKHNGTWHAELTMWMSPDAPPTKTTGTAVNKMILGGRYQESKHSSNFNGMPFEGISTTAYDNEKKVFISSWIDNMGTGIMTMEGPWDETSKTMTLKGKLMDPMTGKECEVRETFKIVDDNTQIMEMYSKPKGEKEFKSMEVKMTRKK